MVFSVRQGDGSVEYIPVCEVTRVTVKADGSGLVSTRDDKTPFKVKDGRAIVEAMQKYHANAWRITETKVTETGEPSIFERVFGKL